MKKTSKTESRREALGTVRTDTKGGVTGALEGGGFRDKPIAIR